MNILRYHNRNNNITYKKKKEKFHFTTAVV